MLRSSQCAALVAAAFFTASTAHAGTVQVPLGVPDASGQAHASPTERVAFTLSSEFQRGETVNGNPSGYERSVPLDDGTVCTVTLLGGGRIQRKRPVADEGLFGSIHGIFRVTQQGRVGALRWYLGPSGDQRLAAGVARPPVRLRSATRRYVLYSFKLSNNAGGTPQEAACLKEQQRSNGALKAAVRSARIVQTS
ncbi:MAG: hypothetical protein ACEQSX_01700 [Baekduiaceae bacterium]